MAFTTDQKAWANEMLRQYYLGMGGGGVTTEQVEALVFGATEPDRIAVAVAYATGTVKPRLEAQLMALDAQAMVVEAEIAKIPVA
jgi:hypothetical protein